MSYGKFFCRLAFPVLALVASSSPAEALIVSATEKIFDEQPFDALNRNLERLRTNSLGFNQTTSSDATIIAENLVDNDFGVYNDDNVTYRHDLTWLSPAAQTYLTGSLQIRAFGVDRGINGANDPVVVESVNLGTLISDGSFLTEGFTTTVFAFNNQAQLNLLLADGFLNVRVNKVGLLDLFSVFESSLTVRYEAVPEPATLLLLGSGLIGGIAARRRKQTH